MCPSQRRPARVDLAGAALLASAVVAVMLCRTWGGQRYPWGSAADRRLTVAALVLLGRFLLRERRPPSQCCRWAVPGSGVRGRQRRLFIATLSLFAAIVFLPVFLQLVTGASATASGLLMLPLLGASALSTMAAGG